nr:ScbA/BarX family gamma-butyrolactone biosynthesis protein [Streptomyces sp. SID14515]
MNYEKWVPRESVHKADDAEVLLTDAAHLGGERYAIAAAWRRDHYLAHHGRPTADPVLLVETVRQAAIHLSHRFFDVSHGMPFVLGGAGVDLVGTLPSLSTAPLSVGLVVNCRHPGADARRLRLELEGDVWAQHRHLGRVRLRWEPMEPQRYALIRRRGGQGAPTAPTEPAPLHIPLTPADVGHLAERDVLIAADPVRADSWWLRLDTEHPVLFDHESDHVPGMALVEAFRQASRMIAPSPRAGAGEVSLLDVSFTAFGELSAPVSITAHPIGDGVFAFNARQNGRELADARIRRGAGTPAPVRIETAC